jgi:diaminopimelate decarboxylase
MYPEANLDYDGPFVVTVALMNTFSHIDGELYAEGVSVRTLAEEHGTPLYIYSRSHIRDRYKKLSEAMAPVDPLICYSVKANSNGEVLRTLANEGSGFDIVSGGELFRALRAGADPSKIVFAGVGKTRKEVLYALEQGILFFSVESEAEAARISECATELGTTGRIAIRTNPDVDADTHKKITTGKKENKFGLAISRIDEVCATVAAMQNVELVGLQIHIGSQILNPAPFGTSLDKLAEVLPALRAKYPTLSYVDIGGGIGIKYTPDQEPASLARFAEVVIPRLKALDLKIVMEPGRYIVGNSGILVTEVQYIKQTPAKRFIIADAGMNDLLRPALYDAYHEIVAVKETPATMEADLVGPICESSDVFAKGRELPDVKQGDLLAMLSAGAYSFSMSSDYNSRPRPAEIMVDGDSAQVIRKRETWEDLVRLES